MILDHSQEHGLRLLEPDDFKRFMLRVAGPEREPRISGVTFVGDAEALIDAALTPTLPGTSQDASWRRQYRLMIDYAASKGWIGAGGALRAHVERGE